MQKSEKPLISGEDILRYIPQRPPVVMVDAFYGIEGDVSQSGFTVADDNIFCRDGVMNECALIENMAQSAALRVGYLCALHGKPTPLGFIGAVDKCEIARRARVGEELHTTVRVAAEIGNVTMAEVEVYVAEEKICSCRLKIFLEDHK
jgi:predicted hotdog family 3-hydroxylacyl-ACP dehydratase